MGKWFATVNVEFRVDLPRFFFACLPCLSRSDFGVRGLDRAFATAWLDRLQHMGRAMESGVKPPHSKFPITVLFASSVAQELEKVAVARNEIPKPG